MKRREFIALGAGACLCPLGVRAQQAGVPVVGYLVGGAEDASLVGWIPGWPEQRRYVEGQNIAFEARWADGHYDRLPTMAAELVRHPKLLELR